MTAREGLMVEVEVGRGVVEMAGDAAVTFAILLQFFWPVLSLTNYHKQYIVRTGAELVNPSYHNLRCGSYEILMTLEMIKKYRYV